MNWNLPIICNIQLSTLTMYLFNIINLVIPALFWEKCAYTLAHTGHHQANLCNHKVEKEPEKRTNKYFAQYWIFSVSVFSITQFICWQTVLKYEYKKKSNLYIEHRLVAETCYQAMFYMNCISNENF